MRSKSGEEITQIYTTSFGARIAIPKSEAMFYELLAALRRREMIDAPSYRFFEANFIFNGYPLAA